MPLDGGFINCLKGELEQARGSHIEKIYMPSKNEFVFYLKSRGFSKKLYAGLNPQGARLGFTQISFENPQTPPMFCMLLRKHLASGKITDIRTFGAERVISFSVQTTNELGDKIINSIVFELIGKSTNLILTGPDLKIIDVLRRSDFEKSSRILAPGAVYSLPQSDKCDILTGDLLRVCEKITAQSIPLCDAILNNMGGMSPLVCRETAFICCKSVDMPANRVESDCVFNALNHIRNEILNGGTPYLILGRSGVPKDFSYININQYQNLCTTEKYADFSGLMERFYAEKEHIRRMNNAKSDIMRLVKNSILRTSKKLQLRKAELEKSKNREDLRVCGELIKANLYRIEKGASKADVENYYDADLSRLTIKLDPTISPSANAARYFKNYKKACTAAATLDSLIEECEGELVYLESVLYELCHADNLKELGEIKKELAEMGYFKKTYVAPKKSQPVSKPMMFEKNGFAIAVGRNNLQNDILTLKTAAKGDLWFHAKQIHGSHVILFTNKAEPDDETVEYAAQLAAFYSKATDSDRVAVDYTYVKYVKKPSGAKPGMVVYSTNKTVFVNPQVLRCT